MRVLQFGGGNFLRCFFDWMLQKVSDATGISYDVTLVQLTEGEPVFEIARAGSYNVLLRGYEGDRYVETLDEVKAIKGAVSPFSDLEGFLNAGMGDVELVVSNSTEAGIYHDPNAEVPHNYPSFLASMLNERAERGLSPIMIMAMELNDRSGDLLKGTLLKYGESLAYGRTFVDYIERCSFYNTLVDRIVPGFPSDASERIFEKLGREDKWLTSGELFHLFVIEGDRKILDGIPFGKAGLNVIVTDDKLDFYHDRKVRILNGAHTASVPVALAAGIEDVDSFASDPKFSAWLGGMMHEEICFAIDDADETHRYADEVLARFRNPALGHKFRSIALNSVSKADTRMSPTIGDYFRKTGKLPERMAEAAGMLCKLYSSGPVADLPGGPLDLTDYPQIKGEGTKALLDSFFPSVAGDVREAMLRVVT